MLSLQLLTVLPEQGSMAWCALTTGTSLRAGQISAYIYINQTYRSRAFHCHFAAAIITADTARPFHPLFQKFPLSAVSNTMAKYNLTVFNSGVVGDSTIQDINILILS